MKVKIKRDQLLHAFQMAAAVTSSRSSKEILRNVKIEVTDDRVVLMGTDLEIGIRAAVTELEVDAPGNVVVPTDRFGAILRESVDEVLQIEYDGQKAVVTGTSSQFQLPAANPEEFPSVPQFTEETFYTLSAPLLRQLVRRTVFATDPDSSRYALGGVLLEFTEQSVTAVGTDGRRLAQQSGPIERSGDGGGEQNAIVPARAMNLIDRTLGDDDQPVQLTTRQNDLLVRSGTSTLYSRLVEGRFPKWRDVFPKHSEGVRIDLPVGPFHAAVRQAAIVTSEERRGVQFQFVDGKLKLAAYGAEKGESHVEMPISYDGEQQSIDLDPRYFNEFLRVLDPDKTFTIELRGSDAAAVCTTDDGYGYVIMPLARDQR